MVSTEQLKALLTSHFASDEERFRTVALQVAAHEARQGHATLAGELRALVDKSQAPSGRLKTVPFLQDADELVLGLTPTEHLADLVLPGALKDRVVRIVHEYRQRSKLREHCLTHRRKILLAGPPGTGKTLTARVLARELNLTLITVLMDKLVTKFMGETSAKLRTIFAMIADEPGVYLFDEFDAIGAERGLDNDVGEMRRVLNSFLQFIERDRSDNLIVAATNNPRILDQALFRRFDDVLHFGLPAEEEIGQLLGNRLAEYRAEGFCLKRVLKAATQLSHSEICQACEDAVKHAILNKAIPLVTDRDLCCALEERRKAYGGDRRP